MHSPASVFGGGSILHMFVAHESAVSGCNFAFWGMGREVLPREFQHRQGSVASDPATLQNLEPPFRLSTKLGD